MNIVLFDTKKRKSLFPLTINKSTADLRVGIYTIKEWWAKLLSTSSVYIFSEIYLSKLYENPPAGDCFLIDSSVWPSLQIANQLKLLEPGEAIADKNGLVAGRISLVGTLSDEKELISLFGKIDQSENVERLNSCADIFKRSKQNISEQFQILAHRRSSQRVAESNHTMHVANIFIEEGVQMEECILNATDGPIYIGKNAELMEGCMIRGPFAMGEGAVLKMGTKVYGGTVLGKYSVGGGEIKNSVIMDFSNKGHDGYLGDSVVGSWCNLGAATNNSNVKNTGGDVSLYDYHTKESLSTGGNKCGVIMGDFCRTAINTSINTGTVIGLCCNVFGKGLTPKFIPDFSWGEGGIYDFEKAMKDINNWKAMKGQSLSEDEVDVLKYVYEKYKP